MYGDRVLETSTSTGTGAIILSGVAPSGRQTFLARFGASPASVAYCIEGVNLDGSQTGQWEVGTGTFDGSTGLTRTTILASSNAGALVNFTAGTKNVFCTAPAAYLLPPGANTQVAYNNAGIPGANANFTYDAATNTVTFGDITGSALGMTIQPRAPTVLEDSGNLIIKTADAVKANSTTGEVRINPGKATGSIRGGPLVLRGGSSSNNFSSSLSLFGSSPTNGGGLSLVSAGGPTAGSFLLQAGTGTGSGGLGGSFLLTAGGSNGANGIGGEFKAEAGNTSGANGTAGAVTFTSGSAFAGGFPGDINFNLGYDALGVNFASIYFNTALNAVLQITDNGVEDLIGFFGATPVVRAAAYTQTFSTASRTVSNPTFTNVSTTAATNITPWGFSTQAQADALATKVNQLAADVVILRQLINSLIDDAQAYGLAQ